MLYKLYYNLHPCTQVKMTHYVSECGSPRWECGVELLVREVCGVTLAVAVCSLPHTTTLQDTELLGLATVSLATVSLQGYRNPLYLMTFYIIDINS